MNASLRNEVSEIEDFRVTIPEPALQRLTLRLRRERADGEAWDVCLQYGAAPTVVAALLDYWCDQLDFRGVEARLNALPLFRTEVAGRALCFVHGRSPRAAALPLLWLHGYSSSIIEAERAVSELCNGTDAFHVVVPSLPGFGLSALDYEPSVARVAETCAALMAKLGYTRYVVHGSDLGAAVSAELARADAEHVVAFHVTSVAAGLPSDPLELAGLSREEKSQLAALDELETIWAHVSPTSALERLAFAARQLDDVDEPEMRDTLRDGLLWSLSLSVLGGDLELQRALAEDARRPRAARCDVPSCVCSFPLAPPTLRRLAQRAQRIVEWHEPPRGGELCALEQPQLLFDSLRRFCTGLW